MKNEDLFTLEHHGEKPDNYMKAVTPPIFMNSLHVFDTFEEYHNVDVFNKDEFYYGRASNPTTSIAEKKIAKLEHGKRALLFSSGMAATTSAIMAVCKTNSHIICMKDVYQPVKRFIDNVCNKNFGMTVTYVKGTDPAEFEREINKNTALIILESPATFIYTVVDLRTIADIAHSHGVRTFIDNTYSTPIFQKPIDFGIDIVMHTLTKYIGGHSDIMGGALVSNDEELMSYIMSGMREWFGGVIGPMEAWLAIRGLRTLDVRVRRHYETAMAIAKYLESHPKVKRVYYPGLESHPQHELACRQASGFTGLLSVVLNGPPENALKFVNELKLFEKGCSWGGFESLAMVPLYYNDQEEIDFLEIDRGIIRMHCGLEGNENLLEDIENALKKI